MCCCLRQASLITIAMCNRQRCRLQANWTLSFSRDTILHILRTPACSFVLLCTDWTAGAAWPPHPMLWLCSVVVLQARSPDRFLAASSIQATMLWGSTGESQVGSTELSQVASMQLMRRLHAGICYGRTSCCRRHQPTKLIGQLPFALYFVWHACDKALWTFIWFILVVAVWQSTLLYEAAAMGIASCSFLSTRSA